MKKIFLTMIGATMLASSPLCAQEQTEEQDIHIPMAYLEIDQKCINTDVNIYNMCLKEEFMKVLAENFTPEQQAELKQQLSDIEAQVAEAEPDYNDPKNEGLKDNPEKIKEFNANNMNLIWKRLLVETLNSVEESQAMMQ